MEIELKVTPKTSSFEVIGYLSVLYLLLGYKTTYILVASLRLILFYGMLKGLDVYWTHISLLDVKSDWPGVAEDVPTWRRLKQRNRSLSPPSLTRDQRDQILRNFATFAKIMTECDIFREIT